MEKNIYSLTLLISGLIFIVSSCGLSPKEAKKYKDKLHAVHLPVVQIGDSLEAAFASYDTVKILNLMQEADIVSQEAINSMKEIEPFTPDSILYKRTWTFFSVFRKVLDNEYKIKFELYCIPDEYFTFQNQKEISRLDAAKKEKLRTAALKLKEAEEEFAERYNLKIVD